FFQAEDGIRDLIVTGVQTCALPIFVRAVGTASSRTWSSTDAESSRSRHPRGTPSPIRSNRGGGRGYLGARPKGTMSRLPVKKTYKLYVGGEFPRSESGRSYEAEGQNVARASRKDLRDAVRAARGAFPGWAGRTAYNRGQVLYRAAEMME